MDTDGPTWLHGCGTLFSPDHMCASVFIRLDPWLHFSGVPLEIRLSFVGL